MTIHANMGANQTELHIPKIHNHDGTTGSGGSLSLGVGSLTATQTDIVLGRQTAGAGAVEEITCTAAGRALIDDASATAQRTTLGLAIGTDIQAYDAQLDDLAALTITTGNTIVADGVNWITVKNNFNGSGAPGVTDDSAAGYGQGSLWYDLAATPDEIYRCTDASVGAASWHNTSLTLSDLGSMASQNSNAVAITGGTIEGTPIGGVTASTGDFTKIGIVGNSNANQLTIQANATQTIPLIRVNDDLGAELFRIHTPELTSLFMGYTSGISISSGGQNVGYGYRTLASTTSGNFLTAVGVNCLSNNINGSQSSGLGNGCLVSVTSANFLTAMGFNCLKFITTGSSCVGMGIEAGSLTAVGNNTTSSTSIYIGNNTKALANADANEIVIGDTTTGIGSNTVALGNDSITQTRLKGKVEMGLIANRMAILGNTSSAADPTTTEIPTDKDMAIHKNTTSGNIFLAFNDGGVIKKVQLV